MDRVREGIEEFLELLAEDGRDLRRRLFVRDEGQDVDIRIGITWPSGR